jgi:tetratricopeptide (TPR) repeat protein
MMKHLPLRWPAPNLPSVLTFLALAALALYGKFLSSPLVFDDFSYFGDNIGDDLKALGGLGLRGLSIATFGWVRAMLGEDLVWQRLANLSLHIANGGVLFLFLRRLFEATLVPAPSGPAGARPALGLPWLAFFGALWFVLNPVAVYGVAYLAQRTILMATLFALLTWWLFLQGVLRGQRRWLLASGASYLLAVLSKEHAIMVPAVALALLLLLRKPSKALLIQVGPIFFLYTLIAAFTFFQIKSGGVVGRAYEPNGANMLGELGIGSQQAHALSVLTQGFLYFKYLLLWLLPNPGWLSVDMLERFVRSYWSWPETLGLLAFLLYPALALYLLLQRGHRGLLGFALLGPWLLFATELSTVRIQETFVLYRSYLWMPCLLAALPFLLQKVAARHAFVMLAVVTLALLPASWNRLTTFSDTFLLWDDALRLAQRQGQGQDNPSRLGRMYHNRGVGHLAGQRYQQAILDFDAGLKILPNYSRMYSDRAVAYLETGRYREALQDYDLAIRLDPGYYNPYLGRAMVHEALGNPEAARLDYARSCQLGVDEVCAAARVAH